MIESKTFKKITTLHFYFYKWKFGSDVVKIYRKKFVNKSTATTQTTQLY